MTNLSIDDWIDKIGEWGKRKGWHDESMNAHAIATKLLLVTSELTEAFEEIRKGNSTIDTHTENGKPEGFSIEIADVVIRIFHLCYELGIDLESNMLEKMAYNETRSYRHGGKGA